MGPMKRQEKLVEAAEIYLALGQLEKYCEIMIELNKVLGAKVPALSTES